MNYRIIVTLAWITLCFLFNSSCKKDDGPSGEEQNNKAAFTVAVTDENCDLVMAVGTYKPGTNVTSSEKVILTVNVTRAGDYEFTTDTINNLYFSAKGKFETTGVHEITLPASGTPALEGTFRFRLIGHSLHFSVQIINDEQVTTEPVPAGIYVKGTIGDEMIDMIFPLANGDGGYAYSGTDTAYFMGLIGYGQYPNNPPGTGDIQLQKQFMYDFYGSSKEQFKEFFKPGNYPIAFAKCDMHLANGFSIWWTDHNTTVWNTKKDYDQSGSYVKIVGIEDGHRTDGQYFVKTLTRIKCKMYRVSDDLMREMNVEMVCYFVRPGA